MSHHLENIISKHHGSTNAWVVFLDVIKYSMRKSVMQQRVVQSFNDILKKTVESVSAMHVTASQKLELNLGTDIVIIPTGDGAAIVFPFQSLSNIHLDFALAFLEHLLTSRGEESCHTFNDNGWCNCHAFFDVRIGVSEGKVIVFKDVNENYNVAGNTINIASRIMGLSDRN